MARKPRPRTHDVTGWSDPSSQWMMTIYKEWSSVKHLRVSCMYNIPWKSMEILISCKTVSIFETSQQSASPHQAYQCLLWFDLWENPIQPPAHLALVPWPDSLFRRIFSRQMNALCSVYPNLSWKNTNPALFQFFHIQTIPHKSLMRVAMPKTCLHCSVSCYVPKNVTCFFLIVFWIF